MENLTITGGLFHNHNYVGSTMSNLLSWADDALAAKSITIIGGQFSSLDPMTYMDSDNEELTLGEDVVLDEQFTFPYGGKAVLDLNGHSISLEKEQTSGYQLLLNDGDLTITDGVGTGRISYTDLGVGGEYVSNTITNRGALTIKGGTIENLSSEALANVGYPYVIDTSIWGEAEEVVVNIEGGIIDAKYYSPLRVRADSQTKEVVANISGGEIRGRIDHQMSSSKAGVKGTLNITGGKFIPQGIKSPYIIQVFGAGLETDASGIVLNIENGVFEGDITINRGQYVPLGKGFNEKFIKGGIFKYDPSKYLSEGKVAEQDSEGRWIVK